MRVRCAVRVLSISALLIGFLVSPAPSAQESEILAQCLANTGITDVAAYLRFDRELRAALASSDPTLLAMLAFYPLRVNDDGTEWIADARTLYARASSLFPSTLRAAVLKTKTADLICRNDGVGYGTGNLWVGFAAGSVPERLGISSLDLSRASTEVTAGVRFVCRTTEQRLVIDSTPDRSLRLRSWPVPKSILEPPTLVILGGEERSEGTSGCVSRIWSFKSGETVYEASAVGCYSDSDAPPSGAVGSLTLRSGDAQPPAQWCF